MSTRVVSSDSVAHGIGVEKPLVNSRPVAAAEHGCRPVGALCGACRGCGISCLYKTIEKCPCQNKAHETSEEITDPKIPDWGVEVSFWIGIGASREYEERHDEGADGVEEESRQRFKT